MADFSAGELFEHALALHRSSRVAEARILYEKVLLTDPAHSGAWYLLGHIAAQAGECQHALGLLGRAIQTDPSHAAAHNEIGNVLSMLERFPEAAAAYERAITINPDSAEFHANRGNVMLRMNRVEEAVSSFESVIARDPKFAGGHYNLGLALYDAARPQAAVAAFDRAIELDPAHVRAHINKGNALHDLARYEEALRSYDHAIALRPDCADAHNGRGNSLLALEDCAGALASFEQAIARRPDYADAHSNRGSALHQLGFAQLALTCYEKSLSLCPDYAGVNYNCGQILAEQGRHAEAVPKLERALTLNPDLPWARGDLLLARLQICDWRGYETRLQELIDRVQKQEPAATPFCMLALTESATLQKINAQNWMARNTVPAEAPAAIPRLQRGERIRVGYFSADFREHPLARLSVELFELHDRSRFEVIAFSYGPDSRDALRKRLERAFDRFVDVRQQSTTGVVSLARELHVDIAVDLTGLTKYCRPRIFAQRAAPLQVGYLGFLGTTGAPWMDYLIADRTLIPKSLRQNYVEHIAYLPCYQANDSHRMRSTKSFTRSEFGLPESGFVFCCFNANYKLTPDMFGSWMRILHRVPGAVLFLYVESTAAADNLRAEAHRHGIDPSRIVFASRLAIPEYLARYCSADLFLDTFPYNAGTTASDALWSGLPVLTRAGETFSSRIASSLLESLGFPELVASSAAEYEELAVALASQPVRLAAIKGALAEAVKTAPLFDARRHTRTVEAAYTFMQELREQKLPPADIFI